MPETNRFSGEPDVGKSACPVRRGESGSHRKVSPSLLLYRLCGKMFFGIISSYRANRRSGAKLKSFPAKAQSRKEPNQRLAPQRPLPPELAGFVLEPLFSQRLGVSAVNILRCPRYHAFLEQFALEFDLFPQ